MAFVSGLLYLSDLSLHFLCDKKWQTFYLDLQTIHTEFQKSTRFFPPSLTRITQQSCRSAVYALMNTCATFVVLCGFALNGKSVPTLLLAILTIYSKRQLVKEVVGYFSLARQLPSYLHHSIGSYKWAVDRFLHNWNKTLENTSTVSSCWLWV